MEEVPIGPVTHDVIPIDTLRQTFFDDLDASSKVNPNRQRPSSWLADRAEEEERILKALHAETMHRFAQHQSSDDTPGLTGAGHSDIDTPCSSTPPAPSKVSQTRRSLGASSFSARDADRHNRGDVRLARAFCAVLANTVAGSLCGIALKKVTVAVAGNICAIVVGIQMLCWTGYATVRWGALVRDCASSLFCGYQPQGREPKNHLTLKREQLLVTLTATVPRRASFWAGVVVGIFFLG
ncbi:hypothetical protein JKF63_03075 [Porcisia hertigi]|uniref:Uncharacterized protein n=1 Tax=Porcisia hertigi TaxID=2761500 RepID=A0A836L4S3_9TRYP|nr:hypothetical protein JKF63_03075 [Porcisia hertigi]